MSLLNVSLLVQEFYAIEAIFAMVTGTKYGSFESIQPSHCRWYEDFSNFRNVFITKFASAIYDYTVLVVAAELRHAKMKASYYIKDYYTNSLCRNEVYHDCISYKSGDILAAGIQMFDPQNIEWEEAYGGEKWWHIAKAGLMRGKVSDCIFVDHCVDLSHNNSIYFDKSAGIFCLEEMTQYEYFLDFKCDCKPQHLIREMRGYVFNRLLWRANNLRIIRDCKVDGFFSPEYDEAEQLLLSYTPVQWGDRHLDCSRDNIRFNDEFNKNRRDEGEDDYGDVNCRLAKCA